MIDEHKEKLMSQLQGRGIKYFQMYLEDNSYKFRERQVRDIFENAQPYLFQIPKHAGALHYEIIKKGLSSICQEGDNRYKIGKKDLRGTTEINSPSDKAEDL